MKKLIILLALVIILIPGLSTAQDRFKAGTWELAIGSSAPTLTMEPTIGYFILDNIEGIVHFDHTKITTDIPSDIGDDTTTTSMMFSAGIAYHIPTPRKVVPYITGGLLYYKEDTDVQNSSKYDTSADAVGIDAGFGLRFLIGVEFQLYSPPQFQFYSPLFLC